MIHTTEQSVAGTKFPFWVTTEEKRVETGTPKSSIRFLFKFKNDMTNEVVYAYPYFSPLHSHFQTIGERHTKVWFEWLAAGTPNNTLLYGLNSKVNLRPSGYWYYWIYEVSFKGIGNNPPTILSPGDLDICTCCFLPLDENGTHCTLLERQKEGIACAGFLVPPEEECRDETAAQPPVLVEEGKMLVSDNATEGDGGTVEVTYNQNINKKSNNTIYIKT